MRYSEFGGDRKAGSSLFTPLEEVLKLKIIPRIPPYIQGYHLTLTTIIWSILILVFSFLAQKNIQWMWATSFAIFLQYVTDSLDGGLNKYRNLGLRRWGYYMDHFLDYIFLGAILTGYSFLVDDHFKYLLFFTEIVFGGYMVNSFLHFAATGEFKISYLFIGPTEIRLLFIIINILLILYGTTYLGGLLPYALLFSLIGLCWVVYRTQQYIWNIDMEEKADTKKVNLPPSFIQLLRYLRSRLNKLAYKK